MIQKRRCPRAGGAAASGGMDSSNSEKGRSWGTHILKFGQCYDVYLVQLHFACVHARIGALRMPGLVSSAVKRENQFAGWESSTVFSASSSARVRYYLIHARGWDYIVTRSLLACPSFDAASSPRPSHFHVVSPVPTGFLHPRQRAAVSSVVGWLPNSADGLRDRSLRLFLVLVVF